MNKLYVVLLVLLKILTKVSSESVLGCGGFVKSHVPIDFSKVEVKLLTKQGILKDKINAAPTNGYYFVPLYDKGEYVLELDPPPGWSFTPTKVDLVVDGVSDLCSQSKDINFVFKGFGITGKVQSLGSSDGPAGIEVELKTNTEIRKTLTSNNGDFFFTPVFPGNHVVRVLNTKWTILKSSVDVVVAESNKELPEGSLIIQGYDVRGSVQNEGDSINDAIVALFSTDKNDHKVAGCDTKPLTGLKTKDTFLCHVKTNINGIFEFPTLPNGNYYVKPFYNEQNIYFQPDEIRFSVNHNSITLPESFEIIGFSVGGRVLKSLNGPPIPNAKIILNGKEITYTGSDGVFKLERLKAGIHNIKVQADGFKFGENSIKLNPNIKKVSDITPEAYRICGTVISEKSHTVTFAKMGSTQIYNVLSDLSSGRFCEHLSPGKYQVTVLVDSFSQQKGLQFYPRVHEIEVHAASNPKIIFSQLKATVRGKIQCLANNDCRDLQVVLRLNGESTPETIIAFKENAFEVSDITPGVYEVSLTSNKFCWQNSKQTLNINALIVQVPTFVQTGYDLAFVASHDTKVAFKAPNEQKETILSIERGRFNFCLPKSGVYQFKIDSCHTYENGAVTYSTDSAQSEVVLSAVKHKVTLSIKSGEKIGEVSAVVTINGVKTPTGPLPFTQHGYQLDLQLAPSDAAVILPQSDVLYFDPPILSISGSSDCEYIGAKFEAIRGVVFKGKIAPALSGVAITVEGDNLDAIMTESDQNGSYKFAPLPENKNYKLIAKKESYVLVGPDKNGDFLAHKLAEIVIEVFDELNKAPLQGTLLSLSGGNSYRSNLQTNELGKITFNSLSPGEYFLRPMMKEYSFLPNSKIIKVKEGESVAVKLIGKRVAYSAFGHVTSLNREPEESISVVALGIGNCSHFSEESTSESSGQFRIRGLQPHCAYEVSVKKAEDGRSAIERCVPKVVRLRQVHEDVQGLHLVVFRSVGHTDLLVKVFAPNAEHYKSLKLKVARETNGGQTVVYNGKLEAPVSPINENNGVLVQLPALPLDEKTYSVRLESNLNNKLEPEPIFLTANSSFKFVELNFVVRSGHVGHDIKQTSITTLFVIFVIFVILYNGSLVGQVLKDNFGGYFTHLLNFTNRKIVTNEYPIDNDDIDQIVQNINAVKRRPKSKRI